MVIRLVAALAVLLCLSGLAAADEVVRERLSFRPGTVSTAVSDRIRGYEVHDYVVGARAGQMMTVSFRSSNAAASFNVTAAGTDSAIFIGAVEGTEFSEVLPSGGDWVVRVGMVRAAARRGEVADYRLRVTVTGGRPAIPQPAPDFADGLAGGPDEWRVSGLWAGDLLNIRSEPSARSRIVASVPNGTRLANGGCRMVGASRWCRVDLPGGSGISGWANGRYLRE
jgi:hypothetical protein